MAAKVYFTLINKNNLKDVSIISRKLLEKVVEDNRIVLEKEIPIKIHPGEPGNTSYIRPENYQGIIDYLHERNIKTYYIETNTVTGNRTNLISHMKVIKQHGFTQIPFVIADGEIGNDHVIVKIENTKNIKECKIAKLLAGPKQIIVTSHFKGHISAGFGAAIKQLGIGFASRAGKMHAHSKVEIPDSDKIDWSQRETLYDRPIFRERMTEYALAAVNHKHYIYITYAVSIVQNCDCDGHSMEPVYDDLGIFSSTDPVAIDKAAYDVLADREGIKPFDGEEIFDYAEQIGLGTQKYELIQL